MVSDKRELKNIIGNGAGQEDSGTDTFFCFVSSSIWVVGRTPFTGPVCQREWWLFHRERRGWWLFFTVEKGGGEFFHSDFFTELPFFIEKRGRRLFFHRKKGGTKFFQGARTFFQDAGGNINPVMRSTLVRYHYHYLPIRYWTRKKKSCPLLSPQKKCSPPYNRGPVFLWQKVLAPFFGYVKMSLGLWKPIQTILICIVSYHR